MFTTSTPRARARVSSVLVKFERAFGNESPPRRVARRGNERTNGAAASVTRVFIIFNDLYLCAVAVGGTVKPDVYYYLRERTKNLRATRSEDSRRVGPPPPPPRPPTATSSRPAQARSPERDLRQDTSRPTTPYCALSNALHAAYSTGLAAYWSSNTTRKQVTFR